MSAVSDDMRCKFCGNSFFVLYNEACERCAKVRERASDLPALDHHGAMLDGAAEPTERFTEADTPEEFSGIVFIKKMDFAGRVVAERVRNHKELAQTIPQIKQHLADSFKNWLLLGIDLAKDDAIALVIEVKNDRGDVLIHNEKLTALYAIDTEETIARKVNELLFELPNLLLELKPMCKKKRNVVFYLKWWGTLKQMSEQEFKADVARTEAVRVNGSGDAIN